ncbi:hypothetical protein DVH24_021714 [Malus domestica]|uniref:Uncharacterized protein n=1 Tax=Malus domestica TaxID=3750 RepID=A0A498K2E2_MALDO|nr:hypothetical protein DVH24_021714 [Malus domestica]
MRSGLLKLITKLLRDCYYTFKENSVLIKLLKHMSAPLKTVAAKDLMNLGERIRLPFSVQEFPDD